MLQISSLKLDNWLVMAPMAGVTNLPFRLLRKKLGAGMVTTEMVSSMGLKLGQKNTLRYLESHSDEKPLAVQIFGADPGIMARAAAEAVDRGADLIDINMGCPVRKVVKTGAGAALLRDPQRAREIISAVRKACPAPLTVKIRAGWSPERPAAVELAGIAEDNGADAVTIHPRFAVWGFEKPADWSWIGRVKERVNIPVLGNGDILEPSHALEMRRRTACDGVMIGRAAIANPWIFRQVITLSRGGPVKPPSLAERKAFILEHFDLLSSFIGEGKAAANMRGLLLWYTKGLPHSSRFRDSITRIRDIHTLTRILEEYFSLLERSEGQNDLDFERDAAGRGG